MFRLAPPSVTEGHAVCKTLKIETTHDLWTVMVKGKSATVKNYTPNEWGRREITLVSSGEDVKTTLVSSVEDVKTTLVSSVKSQVQIPEIEFEIGCDNVRQVDTIYNYIAASIYNLGHYLR